MYGNTMLCSFPRIINLGNQFPDIMYSHKLCIQSRQFKQIPSFMIHEFALSFLCYRYVKCAYTVKRGVINYPFSSGWQDVNGKYCFTATLSCAICVCGSLACCFNAIITAYVTFIVPIKVILKDKR